MKISLTESDLKLIHSLLLVDVEIENQFKRTMYKNGEFTITISTEDLDLFLDNLAAEINHEAEESRKAQLELVFDKLEEVLQKET